MTLILGIESSCDETAAAVVEDGQIVRSNAVATQHVLHERYAGVVPEIASRAHLEKIMPVITEALGQAQVPLTQLDAIAVGNRPGLIGSLIVGLSAAKALAWSLNKPLIGIDHVQAHLYAATLTPPEVAPARPEVIPARQAGEFSPAVQSLPGGSLPGRSLPGAGRQLPGGGLGLVVSGGHTSLYRMAGPRDLTPIGRTIDDAIGEAYDKAAVILAAGYPGGQAIDRLAQQGDASSVPPLPRSILGPDSLDFSFSGLKTALLYRVRGHPVGRGANARFERDAGDLSDAQRADLAAAFQDAAVDVVIKKVGRALDQAAGRSKTQQPRCVILGGGVSANSLLRRRITELGQQRGLPVHLPPMAYCVDNAAMIAGLAYHDLQAGRTDTLDLPAIATTRH